MDGVICGIVIPEDCLGMFYHNERFENIGIDFEPMKMKGTSDLFLPKRAADLYIKYCPSLRGKFLCKEISTDELDLHEDI